MDEVARLILVLVLAGVALTVLGGLAIRFSEESRRIRRSLKKVLKTDPHALLVARGRGRGVGFNFAANQMAVTWDAGAWCLIYKVDELMGAELLVDGEVIARAYRGEPRRALDTLIGADREVRLRLIFDDPRHPDFDLQLWLPQDDSRKDAPSSAEAVQEANRWIARTEAVVRKPLPPRREPQAPAQRSAAHAAATAPPESPQTTEDLPLFSARDLPPPPGDDEPDDSRDPKVDDVN
jgi:hypothetical protein